MLLNSSANELTTAATDALLAAQSLAGALWLRRRLAAAPARAAAWELVFGLLAGASALGALAHGLALSPAARERLWQPIFLLLGLVVAAFALAAIQDLLGEPAARRARWPALGVGVAFWAATQLVGGAFLIFVAYEAVAMLAALGAYVALAVRRRLPGAATIAGGILLDLAAAGVQASALRCDGFVPLDHNGLFHVVQMVSLGVLFAGIGAGRTVSPSGSP